MTETSILSTATSLKGNLTLGHEFETLTKKFAKFLILISTWIWLEGKLGKFVLMVYKLRGTFGHNVQKMHCAYYANYLYL